MVCMTVSYFGCTSYVLWVYFVRKGMLTELRFICLFGICIQNGVIMIMDIKHFIRHRHPLAEAVEKGVHSRIRSVLMTAMMATLGLLPAALSHGIGSES